MNAFAMALLAVGLFGMVLLAMALLHKPHAKLPKQSPQSPAKNDD